jgi:two-component system LytT family response regulator
VSAGSVVIMPAVAPETPIRTLVVDDEPVARQRLVRLLGGMPGVQVVGVCGSGREALQAIETDAPELVFLDISMPGIDGIEVARRFSAATGPLVIFVTAFDEHALEAFRVHAIDYVLKPIDHARLRDALEHARVTVRRTRADRAPESAVTSTSTRRRFAIRDGYRTHLVAIEDILWIESLGNYARVHAATGRFIHRGTMASMADQLAPHGFVRTHRTVIVNTARLAQLRPRGNGQYEAILDTGARLRVSRTFRAAIERLWHPRDVTSA